MLQTIVTHFSKDPVALRAVDKKGKCMYYPPKNKPTSIGCALGMYLSEDGPTFSGNVCWYS